METAGIPDAAPPLPPETPEIADLKQGDTLGGRFVLDELLGRHGVGAAWRAVDEKSGKQIAIMIFDDDVTGDRARMQRLRAAVKLATGLHHKNIVGTFGVGKQGTRRYLAREYVDGRSLTTVLDRKLEAGKRFSLKGAYNLVAHVCNAVQAAGEVGHGLLRPSCVWVNRAGRVRVVDFGLGELKAGLVAAAPRLDRWDRPFALDGTEPIAEADLRALGRLLLTLLTGQPAPDEGLDAAVAGLGEAVRPVVERALDRDRPDRFKSPRGLKMALQKVVAAAQEAGEESLEVVPPTPTPADAPPPAAAPRPEHLEEGEGPADDGSLQRWLVSRDGTDLGPFTHAEVVAQLFAEEITTATDLHDLETDQRLHVSEFAVFEEDVRTWIHEKAKREKARAEAASRARARRRNRLVAAVVGVPLIAVAAGAGGWFWYQSSLPEPIGARVPGLMIRMHGALPTVTLPEELPETFAEKKARKKAAADAAATRRAQDEARKVAREARMAERSELSMGAGTGARFDRGAFDRAVGRRTGQLVKCLEQEARRDPELRSVQVKITVIPKGDLINVKLVGGSARGASCVRSAMSGLKVPAFDGTNHKVTLPFQIR